MLIDDSVSDKTMAILMKIKFSCYVMKGPNDKAHTDVMINKAEIHDDAFQDLAKQGKLTCNSCQ